MATNIDQEALEKWISRIEKILEEGEETKMTRDLRDGFLFYIAHQTRKTNGGMRDNMDRLDYHWRWLRAIIVVVTILAVAHIEEVALFANNILKLIFGLIV